MNVIALILRSTEYALRYIWLSLSSSAIFNPSSLLHYFLGRSYLFKRLMLLKQAAYDFGLVSVESNELKYHRVSDTNYSVVSDRRLQWRWWEVTEAFWWEVHLTFCALLLIPYPPYGVPCSRPGRTNSFSSHSPAHHL